MEVVDKRFDFVHNLFRIGIDKKEGLHLNINYLRDFVVLAQTNSFTEAANILFCSHATLSKHIKSIEKELGIRLFDRTSRKVEITKFGQLLLPYAKQIVELEDQYTAVLRSNLASSQRILNLGSIRALAPYNITDIWVTFQKSRPQSTINLLQASSNELKEMLREKQCELVFVRETGEADDDLVKILYSIDTMVAVLPVTHFLAKQKSIPLRSLANQNLLLMDKYLYKLCTNACRASGFEPKVVHTDAKFEHLIDLVDKGMGVALLMKQIPLYVANPKIAVVEIVPPVTAQINLCYLKGAELSDEAKYFILCTERYVESGRSQVRAFLSPR